MKSVKMSAFWLDFLKLFIASDLSLNFLLYNFQVNGQNVVGMKDKDITKIIDEAGQVVTITVIPNFLYKHIMKKYVHKLIWWLWICIEIPFSFFFSMHSSLVKKMDHSVAEL